MKRTISALSEGERRRLFRLRGSPSTRELDSSANAHAAGARNYNNYKSSPAGSEEGARSQRSAARGGGNRKR